MDGCERIDERSRGIFYHGPTMGAKCSYQNLELWHVRVDVVEWGPELHDAILLRKGIGKKNSK